MNPVWRKSSRSGSEGNCVEVAWLDDPSWRKSSRSTSNSNCVEVAWLDDPSWRKSSRSTSEGNCVEVAHLPGPRTAIRDSKNPTAPALTFPTPTWSHFLHDPN